MDRIYQLINSPLLLFWVSFNNISLIEIVSLAALSTSNSFIIMEDQITLFFVQLVTILQCARSFTTLEWREKFFFAVQIILARLAFEFRRCRPEQFWCYEEGRKVTSVSFVSISIFVAILPIAILTFKVSFNY